MVTKTLNIPLLIHKLFLEYCHIAFYGASVTQQTRGYVPKLCELLLKERPTFNYGISQLGFGSLHLKEGTLLLDDVVLSLHKTNPIHICILEWFTSEPNINIADLHYIIQKLLQENILPIILLLYNDDNRVEREKTKLIYYNIAKQYVLPLIDIDSQICEENFFLSQHFRDTTHLLPLGAEKVASWIFECMFELPLRHFHSTFAEPKEN